MNDRADPALEPAALSAGALLRQARQAQGLHIAALAAQIKVSPRKLDALESDRFDALPDATFARALAQAVCRHLRIDAEPVLSRLPQPNAPRLEHASRGLDMPFRERPGRSGANESPLLARPIVWGPALILVAALAVYLLPAHWIDRIAMPGAAPANAPTPAAPDATAPGAPVVETVHLAPAPAAAASTPAR